MGVDVLGVDVLKLDVMALPHSFYYKVIIFYVYITFLLIHVTPRKVKKKEERINEQIMKKIKSLKII